MRTNEERIAAMHQRAAVLVRERRTRMARVLSVSAAAACLVMIFGLSFYVPTVTGTMDSSSIASGMNASLFADAGALGYVVVGILAFTLGILLTMLCFHLKDWQNESPDSLNRANRPDSAEMTGPDDDE